MDLMQDLMFSPNQRVSLKDNPNMKGTITGITIEPDTGDGFEHVNYQVAWETGTEFAGNLPTHLGAFQLEPESPEYSTIN
jgi:hypothetical protein